MNVQVAATAASPVASSVATPEATPVAPSYTFNQNLSYGSVGDDVRELQKILFADGYLKVQPTGRFVALTQAAVELYQKAHGINAIGVVGPQTRAALNSGS